MDFSLSGTVLTRDLFSADGRLVASRGEIVDLGRLKDVAAKAPRQARERPLFETTCAEAVLEAFDAPALQYLVGSEGLRALAADVLTDVHFPQQIWDELDALKRDDGARYQHAVWTAVVATVAFLVVKAVMGLRVSEEQEREGLDITSHGERAYDM